MTPANVKLAEVALGVSFVDSGRIRHLAEHMLIDVADYAHVPDGPGILLVSDEANIYFDRFDGRLGLTYSRKRPIEGTFADRLAAVVSYARQACELLEASPVLNGAKKFGTWRGEASRLTTGWRRRGNTAATFCGDQAGTGEGGEGDFWGGGEVGAYGE